MPPTTLTGSERKMIVGLAALAVSNKPSTTFTTYSLGSCLGVAIYDPAVRVGGMLHAMLPDSSIDAVKAVTIPAMFIDTGIPALFRAAYELGAEKHRVRIYVAGGAQILDNSGFFNIGKRNYEALTDLLLQHNLNIHAQDVGGLVNRTMCLHLGTGRVTLKSSGHSHEILL